MMFAAQLFATESITDASPYSESPEEWIELYNRGTTEIDLTGWTIDGGIGFAFDDATTIGAGQYLVIAKDSDSLQQKIS